MVASLCSVLKGDVLQARVIAETMGIDHDKFISVLACATGKTEILLDFYPYLSSLFNIGSWKSVQTIIELANGKASLVYDLAGRSSLDFQMEFPETAEALIYISHTGQQIRAEFNEHDDDSDKMLDLDGSIAILFK